MTITEIQNKLRQLLERVKYPKVGTIIGLQEELGKLSKTVMDIEIYNRYDNREEIERNCANTLTALIDVCNAYDVDLQKVCEKRIHHVMGEVSKWESEYGEELKRNRERYDK